MQESRARTAIALFGLWLAAAVAAGTARGEAVSLFKCIAVDGGVSYQSSACEPGSKEVWERSVEAEGRPVPSPSGASAPAPASRAVAPSAGRVALRPAVPAQRTARPRKSDSAACQRAQAADAAYRAQPLSRVRHDGLRRHGDRIRAACG